MSLGTNIQYLRKINKLKQEQFAEKMGVSRQTVSRWESNEVTPELNKLVDMCVIFSCDLDTLVRGDLSLKDELYSEVTVRNIPSFRMAKYVMVSANPESDVIGYMKEWGRRSGLLAADPEAKMLGWDFPYVSQEQQMRFGLHGYVAAYVLPEGFETNCPDVEYCRNADAEYAVITVKEPHVQPFERIPAGYKIILDHLKENGISDRRTDDVIGCFEHEYEKDGICYMDICICVQDEA